MTWLKVDTWLERLVLFIIMVKIVFVSSAIGHAILSQRADTSRYSSSTLDRRLMYWKERSEFIFTIGMALLLIIHFKFHVPIGRESRLLFFLFGIILLLTANWKSFVKEAWW